MNATTKRVKFFSIFPILALIVSSFSILITPVAANAANYKDLSVEDKARAYTYYRAAASCMSGIKNEIKADAQYDGLRTDPSNGYWYGTGDKNNPDRKGDWWSGDAKNEADVTPKSKGSLGTLGCTEITKTALQDYWGGTSPADLLKALKYEWNGDDKWVFKGDGSQKSQYLKDFLSSKGVNMEYTPAVEYFVNYNAFVNDNYCRAKDNGLLASQSDSIKNRYDTYNTAANAHEGKTVYAKVTTSNGTATEQRAYTYTGNPDHPGALQGAYLLYFDNYKTCDQMAANITKHAAAYSDALLTKSCSDAGFSGARMAACKTGFKNPGNPAACDIYSGSEKEACLLGVSTQAPPAPEADSGSAEEQTGEAGTSCAIDGIGWIICPVITFLANIADASFNFISDNFLRTDVKILDTAGPTYAAWTVMRNLANVAFVIIFIFIIFSQVTSMGVSNYGVKKMLPRLVIAAILVNISFIICQLAVDLSNILGYSIDGAIAGAANSVMVSGGEVSPFATGTGFSDTVVVILALGGAVAVLYAMLSVFIPIVLAAVIALVMIMFLLVARQALIVILIVLAPLAFVAFLLPNTERLFTQWRKIFTALLLLFPIIALVFGLSKLASTILTGSFSTDFGGDGAANSMWGQIIGAAVLILPLFIVPTLLKKSLDGIPMIGQLANKWSGRANSKLGGAVKDSYKGSLVGRGNAIRKQARENYRGRRFAERVSQTGPVGAVNRMFAKNVTPILPADRYANKALVRTAGEAASEALVKDVNAAGRSMEGKIDQQSARTIALGGTAKSIDGKITFKGGDVATRMAGIDKVVQSNDIHGMNQLWEASQNWQGQEGAQLRSHLAQRIQSSSSKPAYFGAGALEQLRTGEHKGTSSQKLMTDAVAADAYSPDKMAAADKDELNAVYHANADRAAADATYAVSHGSKLQEAAIATLADAQLDRVVSKNRNNITHIAGNPGGRSSTPPTRLT